MKTVQSIIRPCLVVLVMTQTLIAMPNLPPAPAEARWIVNYMIPEDVGTLNLSLTYGFWDPKIDGDMATKMLLLKTKVKISPAIPAILIVVTIDGKKSTLSVSNIKATGKGLSFDDSFARAKEPKPNYDGFYILAQKPVDPKNPAAMGDTQNAAAWIELGISPQP